MTSLGRSLAASLAGALLFFAPRAASAQGVHWDANVEAGGDVRFRSSGSDHAEPGGLVGVKAHVALAPLVRVGAWFDAEVSPTLEPSVRRYFSGGARLKFTPPLGSDDYRAWIFVGVGYAGVYSRSFANAVQGTNAGGNPTTFDTLAYGAGGGYVEIPVGIGGALRLRKPWQLTGELSGRFGVAPTGSLYAAEGRPGIGPDPTGSGVGPTTFAPMGNDWLAIVLTVGIGVDL